MLALALALIPPLPQVTILTPFYVTNAREQVTVSVDPGLGGWA